MSLWATIKPTTTLRTFHQPKRRNYNETKSKARFYCIKNNNPNNKNSSGSIQKVINMITKIIINFSIRIKTKTIKRNIFS